MKSKPTPPIGFRVISGILLLWGMGGASIYIAYFVETPQEFALTARLLGAIALLLRSAWVILQRKWFSLP